MTWSNNTIMSKNKLHVFRRVWIRTLDLTGVYSDWTRVPNGKIKSFGNVSFITDDIRPNFITAENLTIVFYNKDGFFNEVGDQKSIFYGTLSRARAMIKVEAGYYDEAMNEYPHFDNVLGVNSPVVFIGLMSSDAFTDDKNEITFECKQLIDIFKSVKCTDMTIFGSTLTTGTILADILISDPFKRYFSLGAWNVPLSTTQTYSLITSTTLDGLSVFDLLTKLGEAEGYITHVTKEGWFYYEGRSTDMTEYTHLSGIGDKEPVFGHNIAEKVQLSTNYRKIFNRIKVKFAEPDTLTSYYIKRENWTWGDSSSTYIYGAREYEVDNIFVGNSATAQAIADDIFTQYSSPKTELVVETKFMPHLRVNQGLSVTYRTKINTTDSAKWGIAIWGLFNWGKGSSRSIDINDAFFYIIGITHDIDRFKTTLTLRAA